MPFTVEADKEADKLKKENICNSFSKISDKLDKSEKREIAYYVSNLVQSAQIQGQKKAEMLGDGMQEKMFKILAATGIVTAINLGANLWIIFG